MKSAAVDTPCPRCHERGGLHMLSTTIDVPYFGEGLETTLRCDRCGFRHADFMILSQKDPLRLEIRARDVDDLSVRVIRSNSGTIRIPELGFTAEPTPLSESFVSNVEGVLDRAKEVLLTALSFHGEDPDKAALLHRYLESWEEFASGRKPFTLVIDDPFGNSAIVSDRVQRRPLTDEEVAHLKSGYTVIDKSDLESGQAG